MRRIIVATHGKLAEGFMTSIKLIGGNTSNMVFLNAYVENTNIDEDIKEIMKMPVDEEIIVCTDLLGGSINQKFIPYLGRENFYLVTGINLAFVLGLSMYDGEISKSLLEKMIEECKEQMILENDYFKNESSNETFFERG